MKAKTKVLTVRISEDMEEEINTLSQSMKIERSDFLRRALLIGLARQKSLLHKFLSNGPYDEGSK